MHNNNVNRFKPQPINGQKSGLGFNKGLTNKGPIWLIIAIAIIIIGCFSLWFNFQLNPVDYDAIQLKKISIKVGMSPDEMGLYLKNQGVIKSAFVFSLYARITNNGGKLQAGTYRLSPSESTPKIISHIVNGNIDQFNITFLPGATLVDNTSKPASEKDDITTTLKRAGYTSEEINSAFSDVYTGPLFDGKPSGASLEGYIYGETYNFTAGTTVRDILQRTFDEFYKDLQAKDLISGFQKNGLTLYKAITLASIIQRESNNPNDQKQIAQVFYSRLNMGMVLGSDVTYQYIADKTGVARSTDINSPYNTRKFKGLTPGPISSPGLSALQAVADPAGGNYLYFLSGDDGKTYFSRTEEEHNANRINHCVIKCAKP